MRVHLAVARGPCLCWVRPLQDLLDEAPAGAELVYVGKRGGQPSIKQPDIDKLLVQLCQQVLPVDLGWHVQQLVSVPFTS